MCGPWFWGFWWIFPLIGLVLFAACAFMAFRSLRSGRGIACMGGRCGISPARGDE